MFNNTDWNAIFNEIEMIGDRYNKPKHRMAKGDLIRHAIADNDVELTFVDSDDYGYDLEHIDGEKVRVRYAKDLLKSNHESTVLKTFVKVVLVNKNGDSEFNPPYDKLLLIDRSSAAFIDVSSVTPHHSDSQITSKININDLTILSNETI